MEKNKKEPSFDKTTEDKGKKPENEINEASKKLEECKKLKDEYLNGWKRERADFLNYKKEEMERIRELMKYANEELILKMLPILDNFEVASKNISEKLKNDDNIKGFLQIRQQIKDFLKMQGVEEIKTIGEKFNPNFMEITEEIEIKDKEPGIVVEEIQKGYTSHGKVIRPAKVKVSK